MDPAKMARARARRLGFDPDYLTSFEAKMFVEGDRASRAISNFFALLLLSTIIATYGDTKPLHDLADDLAATLGRPVLLNLRIIPSQYESSG